MQANEIKNLIDPSTFSPWQIAIYNTINQIQTKHNLLSFPYGRGFATAKFGCTENVFFGDNMIMEAAIPPRTYCCGVTLQVFLESWKQVFGDNSLGKEQITEIYNYFFVRDDINKKYLTGAGGAIFEFLEGFNIPEYEAKKIDNPIDLKFGDFVQISNPPPREGHSIVGIGFCVIDQKEILTGWSSTSTYTDNQKSGPGYDWFNVSLQGRTFHIGRIEKT